MRSSTPLWRHNFQKNRSRNPTNISMCYCSPKDKMPVKSFYNPGFPLARSSTAQTHLSQEAQSLPWDGSKFHLKVLPPAKRVLRFHHFVAIDLAKYIQRENGILHRRMRKTPELTSCITCSAHPYLSLLLFPPHVKYPRSNMSTPRPVLPLFRLVASRCSKLGCTGTWLVSSGEHSCKASARRG